ncbi:MAG: NGG1p interacting factor NIF3 [Candidatus Berkelbacteria bacterium]|nr:NGG1p interacting factor NIF3 [Candidatus Berkelbacteria bacterium]
MNIEKIYRLAIKMGIEADPRKKRGIVKLLKKEKEKFTELRKEEKEEFDQEKLKNPYSDTRILFEGRKKEIKKILCGLDIGVSEILLAEKLGRIDLIISHHPLGRGLAQLDDVMRLQTDVLASCGVPINVAENLMEMRMEEVSRSVHPIFHNRQIDAAKLLNIPLMAVHTPADNLCYQYVKEKVEKAKPETLSDIIKVLKSIPEYKEANKGGAGPKIFTGKPERRAGKIAFTELTGGTSGHKDIYERLSQAGVGTIIGMHMNEEHTKEAQKHHISVIIAGHAASDSLGMNLFLDKLEKAGTKVVTCGGLIRVKR